MGSISKSILCIETNKIYKNSIEAQKELGIIASNIRECCRGKRKTAGKLHWKDVNLDIIPEGFIEIPNIPNHYINKNGEIYSSHYHKILKQTISDRGYSVIRISLNAIKKTYRVHRLVAETFIPNPNNYKEINHKDENKKNNCVENLEWCDRKYNVNYGNTIKKIIYSQKIKGKRNTIWIDFHNKKMCLKDFAKKTNKSYSYLWSIYNKTKDINQILKFAN